MSLPLRAPYGATRPQGARRPPYAPAPWPGTGRPVPAATGLRERRAMTREVRRALRPLSLSDGSPCRVLLHEDLSGSMAVVAAAREIVLTELLDWLSEQLRPWDEVGVTSFGGDACVRLMPTPADQDLELVDPDLASYCTLLGSTWDLVDSLPAYAPTATGDVPLLGTPRTVSVLISDGYIADLGGHGSAARSRSVGVDVVGLVLPDSNGRPAPPCWTRAYPDSAVCAVDPQDAGQLARALAGLIADLTGRGLDDSTLDAAEDVTSPASA